MEMESPERWIHELMAASITRKVTSWLCLADVSVLGLAATLTTTLLDPELVPSVYEMVNLKVPVALGVPEILPSAVPLKNSGRFS